MHIRWIRLLVNLHITFFLIIFPECANTEQFRTASSRIKIGFDFYQLTEESNPGRLGEKRERYLCAMPSPQVQIKHGNYFLGQSTNVKVDVFNELCSLTAKYLFVEILSGPKLNSSMCLWNFKCLILSLTVKHNLTIYRAPTMITWIICPLSKVSKYAHAVFASIIARVILIPICIIHGISRCRPSKVLFSGNAISSYPYAGIGWLKVSGTGFKI